LSIELSVANFTLVGKYQPVRLKNQSLRLSLGIDPGLPAGRRPRDIAGNPALETLYGLAIGVAGDAAAGDVALGRQG
jgi:hypothetical protein